jgi:HNH endonuclease
MAAGPLDCLNCDSPQPVTAKPGALFCGEACGQFAGTIRYVRRVTRDGRIDDPLVREAVRNRLAFAVSGGYPGKARTLDPAIRKAVVERDCGNCVVCGQPGTEIDHIASSSADLTNLQLLCHECHQKKTSQNFRPIEAGSPQELLRFELELRISSPVPIRKCDDEEAWPTLWRQLADQRKALAQSG